MNKKEKTLRREKRNVSPILFKHRMQFLLLLVPILVISVSMIWNTTNLQNAINRRTEIYVSDVTQQKARNIDYRLSQILGDLEILRDTIYETGKITDEESMRDFLDSKAITLGFSSLTLVDAEQKSYYDKHASYTDMMQYTGVRESLRGRSGVSVLDQGGVMYSIPVYRDEEIVGALVGIRDKETMQMLIRSNTFSGRGMTCITDREGNVIVPATNGAPFHQLREIMINGSSPQVMSDRETMTQNMKMGRNGMLFFALDDGSRLILSYNPLNTHGWVLMTIVPADIISHQTDIYIQQTLFIVGSILVLFVLLLLIYIHIFRSHYNQLEQIAYVDSITGGKNNAAFQRKSRELIRKYPPNTFTIVQINVKSFSLINEEYGSDAGNDTLCYIMSVLENNLNEEEVVSRGDADNFSLLFKEGNQESVQRRMDEIVAKLNNFNIGRAEPYRLILRQGAYIVDEPNTDITIMQDRALTAGKTWQDSDEGKCIFYDAVFTKQMQKEHELNDLFEVSLTNGAFRVFLQPKVRMIDGLPGGAEALIRWYYPDRGMIFPSDFIPLFERNGKICRLDLFVFQEVCKTLRRWIDNNMDVVPISINLSRQHFKRADFLAPFIELADAYQVPRNLIEMELTESTFFDDKSIEHAKNQIQQIRDAGFSCSLDDFGAGYSSLGLLMEFDVDTIKMDRSFFVDIVKPKTREIVASVIDLARSLGAPVVAEGIETEQQLEFLNNIGADCVMVQGYIFSRPLPIADFEIWLQKF